MIEVKPQIFLKKIFSHPAEKIFNAFSKAEYVKQWFGPNKVKVKSAKIEFKEGANYGIVLEKSNGEEFQIVGTYLSIRPFQSIEFSFRYKDYPNPPFEESIVRIDFKPQNPKTTIVELTQRFNTEPTDISQRTNAWIEMMDKIAFMSQK